MPHTVPVHALPTTPEEAARSPLRLRHSDIPLSNSNTDRFIQELVTAGIVKVFKNGNRPIYIVPTGSARLAQDLKIGRGKARGRGALPAIRNFLRERGYPALNTDQSDPERIVPLWRALGTGTDPKRQQALIDAGILRCINVGGQRRYVLAGRKTAEEFGSAVSTFKARNGSANMSTRALVDYLLDLGFGGPSKKEDPPASPAFERWVNTGEIRKFLSSSKWITELVILGAILPVKGEKVNRYMVAAEDKTYGDLLSAVTASVGNIPGRKNWAFLRSSLIGCLQARGLISGEPKPLRDVPSPAPVNHPQPPEESHLLHILEARITGVALHLSRCRNKRWAAILMERRGGLYREFARKNIYPVECDVTTDQVFNSVAAQAVLARFHEVFQEELRLFRAAAPLSVETAEWSRYLELALDNIHQDYLVEAQEVPHA